MAKPGFTQQKKRDQAFALAHSGDIPAAVQILKKICRKDRQDIASWMGMGVLLAQTGKFTDAIPYFRHVTNIRSDIVDAYINLSSCYATTGDIPSAISTCQTGLGYFPDNVDLLYNLGSMLHEKNDLAAAQPLFSRCIELIPEQLDCYLHLAEIHHTNQEFEAAREVYRKALKIAPDNRAIVAKIANTHLIQGNDQPAYELLAPLVENNQFDLYAAAIFAKLAARHGKIEDAIEYLKASIRQAAANDENLAYAHLELGNLYDKSKRYDDAFSEFAAGNSLKQTNYVAAEHSRYIDSLISIFSSDFIESHKNLSEPDITPVFVVGMPRSGTTLAEQILCSHPSVFGAGELNTMARISSDISSVFLSNDPLSREDIHSYANAYLDEVRGKLGNRKIFTDKMPGNVLRLGFINMLLPNALVIHCVRNPLDTCLSCYTMNFTGVHEYAYGLDNLGHYYNEYRRLMKHWNEVLSLPVLDLEYETLVTAQEETTRQLLSFCNLDWDPACLAFHENKRIANTASNEQVRQPIYAGSIQRWRPYEKHLKPLIDALEPEYRREAGVENWDY